MRMPNLETKSYLRKKPHLQFDILKVIASRGRLSQKQATDVFQCKSSTISEAFKGLREKKLIVKETKAPELNSGIRREKFFKLSPKGLSAFINEHPTPKEFWVAIIWYCYLNPKAVDKVEFDRYYDLLIQKYVGNFPLRSCFFLGNFFNEVFQKWHPKIAHKNYNRSYRYDKTIPTYKVLEFILLNRGATIEDIIASTQLSEQEVRNIVKDYSFRLNETYHYASLYESVYQSSRSVDVTIDFLNHLIVIPIEKERGGDVEDLNVGKYEKYELSLLGILLMMGRISLMRQQNLISYPIGYYNKIAAGYREKLPLIFGKWELLKSNLDFCSHPSIFDYLFLDKSEILSLSVLLGGNKEVYDNVKSAALSTINKFFIVYEDGKSALDSECPKEFFNSKHYQFIVDKLNGIEILLRYSDLLSFAKYMGKKKESTEYISALVSHIDKDMPSWEVSNQLLTIDKKKYFDFKDDLYFIENALAEEFSFLFYIGLLRDNRHIASDYPLTTGYIRPSSNAGYPRLLLEKIVYDDSEILNKVTEWIKETSDYQKLALEKMNKISTELQHR